MSDMNRSFAGSMPEFYDRILVPVMFEPFALDLAERLRGMSSGQRIGGGERRRHARARTDFAGRGGDHRDRSEPGDA